MRYARGSQNQDLHGRLRAITAVWALLDLATRYDNGRRRSGAERRDDAMIARSSNDGLKSESVHLIDRSLVTLITLESASVQSCMHYRH